MVYLFYDTIIAYSLFVFHMHKSLKTIGVISFIAILIGGGIFFWSSQSRNEKVKTEQAIEKTSMQKEITETKQPLIYTNDEFGFSLSLPAEWERYKVVVLNRSNGETSRRTSDVDFFYVGSTGIPLLAEIHILVPSNQGESFVYFDKNNKVTSFDGYVDKRNFIVAQSAKWKKVALQGMGQCVDKNQMDCFTSEVNRLKTMVADNGKYIVFDDNMGEYTKAYWDTIVSDDPFYFSKEDRFHFN